MQGLEGLRVLELGDRVSAAYAAKVLADIGADVVKLEEPGGDRTRRRGPFPGGIPHPEKSGLFLYLNTNKRSVVLDPRTAADRDRFRELVAWADVLVHAGMFPTIEGDPIFTPSRLRKSTGRMQIR